MIKKILFIAIISVFNNVFTISQPEIIEAKGWYESAYVSWSNMDDVEEYQVFLSGEGIDDRKINDFLIREYKTYHRADILGLTPGTYILKVVAILPGNILVESETEPIFVYAHDRTGFSFSNNHIPGAYNNDGSPMNDALILYITEKNKDEISLIVEGANENPCVGLQEILDGFKKGQDNRPLIVRLVGQISDFAYLLKGDIVIENKNNEMSHITLEGVGDDAVADGWGIRIKNATNVEIRNIGFMNCNSNEGDNISLQQNNDHIWVHHCDFFYGHPGGDSDQEKGDGALDCKKSGYVTISYNHFWDSGKTNLLGNGVEEPEYLSYHKNWYDHSDSRHPRVRNHSVHVYNNYFDGISKYGAGATMASSVFVEANYFRNCKYPMLISMQGSDVFDEDKGQNDYSDMPTFSKEDGGMIKAFNNLIFGEKRFVPYGDPGVQNSQLDFDAVVTSQRDSRISEAITTFKGSNSYNNFDTEPDVMYAYEALDPLLVPEYVMENAGRMEGGDFQWDFDDETDDISYDINPELKHALVNYSTKLIEIQAESFLTSSTSFYRPEAEYHVFPNPTSRWFQLYPKEGLIKSWIAYPNGKIFSNEISPLSTYDIGSLNTGVYWIIIAANDGIYTLPVIKQ